MPEPSLDWMRGRLSSTSFELKRIFDCVVFVRPKLSYIYPALHDILIWLNLTCRYTETTALRIATCCFRYTTTAHLHVKTLRPSSEGLRRTQTHADTFCCCCHKVHGWLHKQVDTRRLILTYNTYCTLHCSEYGSPSPVRKVRERLHESYIAKDFATSPFLTLFLERPHHLSGTMRLSCAGRIGYTFLISDVNPIWPFAHMRNSENVGRTFYSLVVYTSWSCRMHLYWSVNMLRRPSLIFENFLQLLGNELSL